MRDMRETREKFLLDRVCLVHLVDLVCLVENVGFVRFVKTVEA